VLVDGAGDSLHSVWTGLAAAPKKVVVVPGNLGTEGPDPLSSPCKLFGASGDSCRAPQPPGLL